MPISGNLRQIIIVHFFCVCVCETISAYFYEETEGAENLSPHLENFGGEYQVKMSLYKYNTGLETLN